MNDWKYDSYTPLNWLYSSHDDQQRQEEVEEKKSSSFQWRKIGMTIILIMIIHHRISILRFLEKIKYIWMDLQWTMDEDEEEEEEEEEEEDEEDFITMWITYWKHNIWIPIIRDPLWNIITNSNHLYSTTTTTNSSASMSMNSTTRHTNNHTHYRTTTNTTNFIRRQQQNQQPLPKLEHVDDEKKIEHDPNHHLPSSPQYNTNIEPAFPSDQQYPPGWLMYHPTHGVVTKEKLNDLLYNPTQKQQQ